MSTPTKIMKLAEQWVALPHSLDESETKSLEGWVREYVERMGETDHDKAAAALSCELDITDWGTLDDEDDGDYTAAWELGKAAGCWS